MNNNLEKDYEIIAHVSSWDGDTELYFPVAFFGEETEPDILDYLNKGYNVELEHIGIVGGFPVEHYVGKLIQSDSDGFCMPIKNSFII